MVSTTYSWGNNKAIIDSFFTIPTVQDEKKNKIKKFITTKGKFLTAPYILDYLKREQEEKILKEKIKEEKKQLRLKRKIDKEKSLEEKKRSKKELSSKKEVI